ncbi:uncharacterized protein HMPREF1541_05795 [Cyphellophora europaea CBS 101466]|uniref:Zn(2)-C6 fungal-type domain-containing protein n=1 Tax=Cyphellophora europaea (strain CBS 101466) TaxID=1220924 RepID=W2RV38_CYPE1|nr:uncharacterized protein HMPREF1541_05795 [Cyphellophora europaea CBS 101466]ETN39569.1 hypothetical protein HMPREF1541_05795 [Cyphellophora europaea CBS 101466]
MVEAPQSGKAAEGTIISCERCRRRKIKCDRRRPCARCQKAGTACVLSGTGEKQRPVPRRHVQALESQIAALDAFIQKLASSTASERDEMLADYNSRAASRKPSLDRAQEPIDAVEPTTSPQSEITEARARAGQLRSLSARPATQFFGGTSAYQLHVSEEASVLFDDEPDTTISGPALHRTSTASITSPDSLSFEYPPHHPVCRQLMTTFFKQSYYYNMYVYREWFLRDWDAGAGPYYSEVLLYSMCALGARLSEDPEFYALASLFMDQSQALLLQTLEKPDLTTLQSLIMLGYLEIGQGKASKGWLFCGMAFRLAHEMGLHLDPNNWTSNKGLVDREIFRRVYWTAYVADKQLSLHFGRPPALYPHESDVRNTIRIPYPPEWESLLDTYISTGTSATAYEDGIALVASLVYQIELSKILHDMIVDVFENRHQNATVAATAAQRVHVSLTKWLSELPGKLHWNQWTVGQVPSYVLHLHMLFHTAMTILHRPPRHLFHTANIAQSEDVEICYASLSAVLRLITSYSRHYRLADLPLDFVHILSSAAGTVLMKRFFDNSAWTDSDVAKPLATLLGAMEEIQRVWPCVREIKGSIERAMQTETQGTPRGQMDIGMSMDIDLGPVVNFAASPWTAGEELELPEFESGVPAAGASDGTTPDLGLLLTDDFLTGQFEWDTLALP